MADTVETAKRRRISGLEVLRGYAAFAVLLFHIEALYLPLPAGALKSTIEIFSAAVPLFFALSAYFSYTVTRPGFSISSPCCASMCAECSVSSLCSI